MAGTHWTIQQFSEVCGRPWYALQKQDDGGVIQGFTGYRHELTALCELHGIEPEELEPISEAEYLRRALSEYPPDRGDGLHSPGLAFF